jgi:hypothetical protein
VTGLRARIALLALAALAAADSAAQPRLDRRIAHQGRLQGFAGRTVTLVFELHDAAGNRVWGPEAHAVTTDASGSYATVLGASALDVRPADGVPDLDQVEAGDLELQISVHDGGSRSVLSPRQRIFPAFHAYSADRAQRADAVAGAAVTGAALQDGAVTARAIRAASVGNADIAPATISSSHLKDGEAIGSLEILDGTIGLLQMGPSSVGAEEMRDDAVGTAELQTGAAGTDELGNRQVSNAHLALALTSFAVDGNERNETEALGAWDFCALAEVHFQDDNGIFPQPLTTRFCRVYVSGTAANGEALWFLEKQLGVVNGGLVPGRCMAQCF